MEQFRAVFVLVWYIYVIENYLLTRAENNCLDLRAGTEDTITCGDQSVIKIIDASVYGDASSCDSNECVLNDDDFTLIEARCNDYQTCTVGFQKNISCMKEDRNFRLSYSCFAPRNLLSTFEFSFGIWKNGTNMSDNGLQWKRYSTNRSKEILSHIPENDHTTKSKHGFYIYLKKQMSLRGAILKSGNISFNMTKCLVFWYNMDNTSTLIINRTSDNSSLFRQKGNGMDNEWEVRNVQLVEGESAEIVIEGIVGPSSSAYIAVDDIDIQECKCYDAIAPISCNFEENLCGFDVRPIHGLSWARRLAFEDGDGRPSDDHTSGHGFYIFTQSLSISESGNRLLTMEFQNVVDVRCLSFWYYMYHKSGYEYGHLKYTVEDETGNNLSSIIDTRKMLWRQFQANVYHAKKIILDYSFTPQTHGGIALDDVYISPIVCAEEPSFQECVDQHEYLNIECPDSDVRNNCTDFDPNILMSCQTTIDQIYDKCKEIFQNCSETAMCFFSPAELLDDKECFYMSKHLNLNYSCIEPTTSETNDVQTISTSSQTDVITDSLQSDSPSSTPVIGIVVGVVLTLVALSVILVIAFIYLRRSRYAEKKGHSIVANEDSHSDYTGHQNIAFTPEVNVTTQTDYCEKRKSKLNEHNHDISDTISPSINTTNDDEYSEIANVVNSPNSNRNASTNYQHQYIALNPNATRFDRSNPQTNLNNESKNNHNSNETTSLTSGDDYAILDPDDLNESKNNTPKVLPLSDNYVVLDPNETGFNRKENMDRVLATPTVTSEDPYDVSKDETYDTSSNSRHKEQENNIYSHTVDNVYDIAGNQKKKEENDGTYDHFFGQKSEDDYDISKPI